MLILEGGPCDEVMNPQRIEPQFLRPNRAAADVFGVGQRTRLQVAGLRTLAFLACSTVLVFRLLPTLLRRLSLCPTWKRSLHWQTTWRSDYRKSLELLEHLVNTESHAAHYEGVTEVARTIINELSLLGFAFEKTEQSPVPESDR